ncbi:MAG: outer membrane lipoprotein carrier protein LolA [Aliivibrio sp.]|nr:outer membrane lipoprotein carrier protein LolA [Aliivibrio sp.]
MRVYNKIKNVIWSMALILFSMNVFAVSLDSLQQTLSQHSVVRGEFAQQRTMALFSKPLTSRGTFLLADQRGLIWQQTVPFPTQLRLTKEKLSQSFDGGEPQIMTAKDNPMAFYFSHIFLSLFRGDTAQLHHDFVISLSGDEQQWTLSLTPKSAPLSAVFSTIEVKGNQYITHVILNEIRGDRTAIVFSQQSSLPLDLTEQELKLFEF